MRRPLLVSRFVPRFVSFFASFFAASGASLGCAGASSTAGDGPVDAAVNVDARGGGDDAGADAPSDATFEVSPLDGAPDVAAESTIGASLAATGLYASITTGTLAADVRAYAPRGVLYADGATKQRWVHLPAGAPIDTTDMDQWVYPVGTKVWKEFALDGRKVETRLLEKTAADAWTMVAYLWNAAGTDAFAVPAGAKSVLGTDHDVPSSADCALCHTGRKDKLLGFTAVQLSRPDLAGDAGASPGLTLEGLAAEGRLTTPPAGPIVVPGDPTTATALLYLHANCGHCHNATTTIANLSDVDYFLYAARLATPAQTSSEHTARLSLAASANVDATKTLVRMRFRGQGQMPPLGTKHVDDAGVAAVRAWFVSLEGDGGIADAAAD